MVQDCKVNQNGGTNVNIMQVQLGTAQNYTNTFLNFPEVSHKAQIGFVSCYFVIVWTTANI